MLVDLDLEEIGFIIAWGHIAEKGDGLGEENKCLLKRLERKEKIMLKEAE